MVTACCASLILKEQAWHVRIGPVAALRVGVLIKPGREEFEQPLKEQNMKVSLSVILLWKIGTIKLIYISRNTNNRMNIF